MSYAIATGIAFRREENLMTLAEIAEHDAFEVDEFSAPIDRLSEDEPSDIDVAYILGNGIVELGNCTDCAATVRIDDYANRCIAGGWVCEHCHNSHVAACDDCWEF